MSAAPVVSVLMPVFNAESYVSAAIESILSQTFREFEFVVVDDGSTDGSAGIVRSFAAEDARIQLIRLPHGGIVTALNHGLSECRGEFVARMDADDVSLPDRLGAQVDFLRRNPACVAVGCAQLLIDPEGAPISVLAFDPDHGSIHNEHLNGIPGAISHPASMLRRAAVLRIGGYSPEFETLEDFWLFLRLGEEGELANLPQVLHQYRQHHSNLHFLEFERQQRYIGRIVAEARERNGLPPLDHPAWSGYHLPDRVERHRRWSRSAAGAGNRKTALKHALVALRYEPFASRSWLVLLRSFMPGWAGPLLKPVLGRR
jgi:glycosyltransferase involved in cell wall biosynthesis